MSESRGSRIAGWGTANLLVIVFALFPVFWIAMLSFKTPATIADGRLIPSDWSTENYSQIFKQSVFTDALRNSLVIALLWWWIGVVLASMAASAIARLDFPGKPLTLTRALAFGLFPPISIVGPL